MLHYVDVTNNTLDYVSAILRIGRIEWFDIAYCIVLYCILWDLIK